MDKVSKTLFRSVIRFCRQDFVKATPLFIPLGSLELNHNYGFGSKEGNNNIILKNSKQLINFIRYSFRNNRLQNSLAMDQRFLSSLHCDCFTLLRHLNSISSSLKSSFLMHKDANANWDKYHIEGKLKFSVGQAVKVSDSVSTFGIIIGWVIHEEDKNLYVRILQTDFSKDSDQYSKISISANRLESLGDQNPYLNRIPHDQISEYFKCYDFHYKRYIPNREMAFLYSNDCEYFKKFEILNIPINDNLEKYDLENLTNVDIEFKSLYKSSVSILQSSLKIAKDLLLLFDKYSIHDHHLIDESFVLVICKRWIDDIINSCTILTSFGRENLNIAKSYPPDDSDDCEYDIPRAYEKVRLVNYASSEFITLMDIINLSQRCCDNISNIYNELDSILQMKYQRYGAAFSESLVRRVSFERISSSDLKPIIDIDNLNLTSLDLQYGANKNTNFKSKFQIGDIVYHPSLNRYGRVLMVNQIACKPMNDDSEASLPVENYQQPFYDVIFRNKDFDKSTIQAEAYFQIYTAEELLEMCSPDIELQDEERIYTPLLGDDVSSKINNTNFSFGRLPVHEECNDLILAIDNNVIDLYSYLKFSFMNSRNEYHRDNISESFKKTCEDSFRLNHSEATISMDSLEYDINKESFKEKSFVIEDIVLMLPFQTSSANQTRDLIFSILACHPNTEMRKCFRLSNIFFNSSQKEEAERICFDALNYDPNFYSMWFQYTISGTKRIISPIVFDSYPFDSMALVYLYWKIEDRKQSYDKLLDAFKFAPWSNYISREVLMKYKPDNIMELENNHNDDKNTIKNNDDINIVK